MLCAMSAQESSYPDLAPAPPARAQASAGAVGERVSAALGTVKLQLAMLLALAGALNLWALARNGWANDYYSAAVRSMSTSWHDFLFASMDPTGVMTVDKSPLALWVQALSVRVFGYHPLSILLPQALMGMASVALVYDLVRRRFGRLGGFVAGLALALTPIAVAISRHNNPDALLVLCSVAALWCTVRALDPRSVHSTRWLVLAGACVGLGFEAKMGVALLIVPGIVAAWLWVAPHGRKRALAQLLGAGGAMALIGGAWPALIELTPAADRPWVSGTSGNRIWELITEYNGFGRVVGQSGGPGGGGAPGGGGPGGLMFGGSPGPLRLLNEALGGQAGWLLGIALVGGVAVLLASRLRRGDPRSGWLIAVGGSFAVVALVFSAAQGIFHPYYTSLLAPFAAALTGAGVAQLRGGERVNRLMAPLAIVAGVVCEAVVLHDYAGQLTWLVPLLIVVGAGTALVLALTAGGRIRTAALGVGVTALLIGPGIWAVDTLGYATNGTFPEGGPQSVLSAGFPGGGPRGIFARRGPLGGGAGVAGPPPLPAGMGPGGRPGLTGRPFGGRGAALGAPLGNGATIARAIAYAKSHGGGTVAVSSQSSAAAQIVASDANVAGIGGFSGRESEVSVAWLADAVRKGDIRWVLSEGANPRAAGPRLPGDTREGSRRAIAAAEHACRRVTLSTGASASVPAFGRRGGGEAGLGGGATALGGGEAALYDCAGRAGALLQTRESRA